MRNPHLSSIYSLFQPLTHVIARNLIKELTLAKPILLSVALKDSSASTVKTLAKLLPSLL